MLATQLFDYRPDYAVPPGQTLRDTLSALGMSQADLARRTGLSTKHVNQIVQGVAALSPETALALEHVTGVPARLWSALEVNYRQREVRHRRQALTKDDVAWLKGFPIDDLIRRGAMPREHDQRVLFDALLRFFGVANRESWLAVWLAPESAFRRSKVFASDPHATATWLRLGEIEAARVQTPTFSRTRFRSALDEARRLLRKHPKYSIAAAAKLCREAGVCFEVVEEVRGSRASGAARWLSPSKALIQLSLRYSWEDTFWFSFFHEAGHLMLHGKRGGPFVDDESTKDAQEREADNFAANLLIDPRLDQELRGIRTPAEAEVFARRQGLPPGIVVGRLQHEGLLAKSVGNRLRHRLTHLDEDGSATRL